MKKVLIILGTLILINTVSLCAEEINEGSQEGVSVTSESIQGGDSVGVSMDAGSSMSKGDSFMTAFGMGDSGVVGGGEAGSTGGNGGAVVATSTAGHVANQGITPGGTPYTYK